MFEFSFSFKYQISFLLRVFSVIFHWNWLPEIRDIETFPTKIQHLLHFKNTQPPINFHVHSEYREAMEIQFPLNVSALLHHHKHWSPASVIFVELSVCVCVCSHSKKTFSSALINQQNESMYWTVSHFSAALCIRIVYALHYNSKNIFSII